jgi:hypothetical protein
MSPTASAATSDARIQDIAEAHIIRANKTRERLRLSAQDRNLPVGTSHTTASLLDFEKGGSTVSEEKVTVCWQVIQIQPSLVIP